MNKWCIYVYLATGIAFRHVPSQEACHALADDVWHWHPGVEILCCEVGVDCPEIEQGE